LAVHVARACPPKEVLLVLDDIIISGNLFSNDPSPTPHGRDKNTCSKANFKKVVAILILKEGIPLPILSCVSDGYSNITYHGLMLYGMLEIAIVKMSDEAHTT
jgi:hypothetical protein